MSIGLVDGLQNSDGASLINTPWIDFSQQSTIVGWSIFTTRQIRYKVVGNIVYVYLYLSGTSNSTQTTFTLPFLPKNTFAFPSPYTSDNGVYTIGGFGLNISGNVITLYRTNSASNTGINNIWTASGTKEIYSQFFYEI